MIWSLMSIIGFVLQKKGTVFHVKSKICLLYEIYISIQYKFQYNENQFIKLVQLSLIIRLILLILIACFKLNTFKNYSYEIFPLESQKQFLLFPKYNLFSQQINNSYLIGMLSLPDLNHIIKYYAYRIQQRIEQLEHLNFSFNLQQNPDADNQEYEFIAIVAKYHHYTTNNERQVKLAKKLAERILQIYDFFKMKSNNQNLLHLIQQKIQAQIKQITVQIPINLGELFTYVHFITKKGCLIKVPAEKKQTLSKSIIKQSNKIDTKISPTLSLFNIQRRATSITSSDKQKLKPPLIMTEKWKIQEAINGIWSGLEIDRHHLTKVRDGNQNFITKEMMKRNEKIGQTITKYDRRCKKTTTQISGFEDPRQSIILTQLKTNSIKAIWFSKKRRPMMSSKKRNPILKENISTVC